MALYRGNGHMGGINESNAEVKLLLRVQRGKLEGDLHEGPLTGDDRRMKIPVDEKRFTIPDQLYIFSRVAVFLDGPHHDGTSQSRFDRLVDEVLEAKGLKVLRFRYKPPASKKLIEEWYMKIRDTVNSRLHLP